MSGRRVRQVAIVAGAAGLVALPGLVTDAYVQSVLVLLGIYGVYALALDFLVGFLGEYSFGHAAYLGVGAYVTGIVTVKLEWSFWVAVPIAMLVAGLLGLVIAVPSLRLRGVYFAIATLGYAEVLRLVVLNWTDLTRGAMGLSVPEPTVPFVADLTLGGKRAFYYLVLAVLVLCLAGLTALLASRVGRSIVAIRENHRLAAAVGIPVLRVKVVAFMLSAMIAALAGAIYAPFVGFITPDLLGVNYSALGLLMVIIGGKGTLAGALVGAGVFTAVTEVFRLANEWRMIVFAAFLLVVVLLLPSGLVSLFTAGVARVRRRVTA